MADSTVMTGMTSSCYVSICISIRSKLSLTNILFSMAFDPIWKKHHSKILQTSFSALNLVFSIVDTVKYSNGTLHWPALKNRSF